MSNIAEQKSLEAYPKMSRISESHGIIPADNKSHRLGDANEENREAFIKGYDQAMQDFLEKACEWLSKNARNYYSAYATSDKLIEHFKNYMQDEN